MMEIDKPNFTVTSLRKRGGDMHNTKCLEKGEGEIILARRPVSDFNIIQLLTGDEGNI